MTTRAIHLNVFAIVFFLLLFVFRQASAGEYTLEDYEQAVARAQDWFLDSSHSLAEWRNCEKLGAAEVLYFTLVDGPEGREERIRARIREILVSLLNLRSISRDPNVPADACTARAIILSILTTDITEHQYSPQVTKLVDCDADNGLAWLLKAEQAWLCRTMSELDKMIQLCHKALDCPTITFRDEDARKRMAAAMRKAGLLDSNMMRGLVLFKPPLDENKVIIRQTALLSFLDTLQNAAGVRQPAIRKYMAEEYLCIISHSRMMPQGAVPHIIRWNLLRKRTPVVREKGHAGRHNQLGPDEEEILLRLEHRALRIQAQQTTKLSLHGTVEEVKQFIQDPDQWWADTKAANRDIQSAPDISMWRDFWRGAREEDLTDSRTSCPSKLP
ncbi:MAG: hypothetical protein ACYTEQ_26895 [Planctomycetota bacterium]|jgi:hypothetical protein